MEAEPDRVFAPEGESWNSFHQRVEQMLARIPKDYEGRTVVAVCHAGVIMASVRLLLAMPRSDRVGATLKPANTGLTEWEHDEARGQWVLHSFNEAAHLLRITAPG